MIYLLDVNLLVALGDLAHPHFSPAQAWFTQRIHEEGHRWATCPLTENGFIRILSNPNHPSCPGTVADTAALLERLRGDGRHDFWPDDISLLDAARFNLARVAGPKQLTDAYLLGLAIAHGGRLVTLEQNFPITGVHGGADALERVSLAAGEVSTREP